jgi:hypothetical protein
VNKRLGVAGIILLIIAIAVWVASPKHSGSSGSQASTPGRTIPKHEAQAQATDAWNPVRPNTIPAADLDLICNWKDKDQP